MVESVAGGSNGGGNDVKTKKLSQITSDSARRLVEYFCIVSSVEQKPTSTSQQQQPSDGFSEWKTESYDDDVDDESLNVIKFRPMITARYPLTDHADNPLHENVTFFCHPSGGIPLRTEECLPKVHFFVATGGTGKQIYGTCLTIWEPISLKLPKADGEEGEPRTFFLPKCLVLLSMYPYLAAFREFLTQLHHLCKGQGSGDHAIMKLPLERHVLNFCAEIPAPPPGSFEVQTTILDSVIKIWSPPNNLPITWVSIPFGYTFECLDIDNVILVWHCLALERQVLITSTQLSILTQTTEIFLSLLFPMRWSHAYIPVLPTFLIPMLSAPMPFLCGIHKMNLADALYDLSRECVLVDLDKNTVTLGPDTLPLPPLPPFQAAALQQRLEDNVGMIFREARSLTKNDDYSNAGAHLASHVKMMAEAMWESRLCLFDEAFHLMYTPEEARKNLLNGNDASGLELSDRPDFANPLSMVHPPHVVDPEKQSNRKKQSQWDAVQEGFLDTFVYLLRNYRKYLVFPSKHNEGSYGGAGFRSKEFIESQRYDMRGFLEQLIGTQMFDNFITKRLYGSGEADVAFFDRAVDKFLKNAGMFADVDLSGRLLGSSSSTTSDSTKGSGPANSHHPSRRSKSSTSIHKLLSRSSEDPLLQSAKVHRALKTIVPPEPTGEGLPENLTGLPGYVSGLLDETDDDNVSVHSATSRNSQISSPSRRAGSMTAEQLKALTTPRFVYKEFPSTFSPELFGTPRPLSAAVIAEFDRQRKDAAQFRRKGGKKDSSAAHNNKKKAHIRRAHATVDPEKPPSPEAATFTVFFMAFTALVGKELMQMAAAAQDYDDNAQPERDILSTYVPTGGLLDASSDGEHSDVADTTSVTTDTKSKDDDEEEEDDLAEEPVDEAEKADIAEMKADRPNLGGMFGDDSDNADDVVVAPDHPEQPSLIREATSTNTDNSQLDAVDLLSVSSAGGGSEHAYGKGETKAQSAAEAAATTEEASVHTSKTEKSSESRTGSKQPRKRFHDKLSDLQIEEAKATGRAQLALAFEMLTMMKKRALQADPEAYQSLIDACGRVGDTKRATELLAKMHEDGIVADGTVYACLVSAFSAETAWKDKVTKQQSEDLPEWANSTAVEMDWNKLQKRTFLERMIGQVSNDTAEDGEGGAEDGTAATDPSNLTTYQKLRNRVFARKDGGGASDNKTSGNANGTASSNNKSMDDGNNNNKQPHEEFFVTEAVERQIGLGENLLEIVFPDISVDTENEVCPRCNFYLSDDDVVGGWTPADNNDYTTACPNCTQRFVPHFCVQSSSPTFMGSKGPASPLLCERLSPWVLQKEIRSVMSSSSEDASASSSLLFLDPAWREKEYKNAVLWWNLVLSCMRYRLPFTFLLQGSFEQNLIAPLPEDDS